MSIKTRISDDDGVVQTDGESGLEIAVPTVTISDATSKIKITHSISGSAGSNQVIGSDGFVVLEISSSASPYSNGMLLHASGSVAGAEGPTFRSAPAGSAFLFFDAHANTRGTGVASDSKGALKVMIGSSVYTLALSGAAE